MLAPVLVPEASAEEVGFSGCLNASGKKNSRLLLGALRKAVAGTSPPLKS